MTLRKRLSLAWHILTGRMGYSVFSRHGETMKLVHSTLDESEMFEVGKVAIKSVMNSDVATHIVVAMGTAKSAAEVLSRVAPMMKGPIITDPKDIN